MPIAPTIWSGDPDTSAVNTSDRKLGSIGRTDSSSTNQEGKSDSIELANGKVRIGTLLYADYAYYPQPGFPQIPFDLALPASGFFLGADAVVISSNTISTPAKYYSTATNAAGDGWGLLAVNAINQGYVDPTSRACHDSPGADVRNLPCKFTSSFRVHYGFCRPD